jgi:hypothetical protein
MMINGLKNVGTIQSVIEENNTDMTDERISEVSKELEKLDEFLNESHDA